MFSSFTEDARKLMVDAKKEMYELKHPYVGSEHLLLSILKNDNDIALKLRDYGLTYDVFRKEIVDIIGMGSKCSEWFLYTPLLKRIIEGAIVDSKENNDGVVTVNHLFSSLLSEGEGVAIRIMMSLNIDIDALYSEFSYKIIPKKIKGKKLLLDELGIDLCKKAREEGVDPVIGRDKEIKRILEILCRRCKNNPILIGDAGVGKTAIVEELGRLISMGLVPSALRGKRIISLDMATLVAGTKYRGEFEERVRKVLKEAESDDDIILFIDEVHTLVGAGGAEGAIDASNIFKPALARGKIRLIGATTTNEYHKFIEVEGALERRFQRVLVDIPSECELRDIMVNLKGVYEDFHGVCVDNEIIDLIISLSNRFIYDRNEPDRSIDILDEVCSYVRLKDSKESSEYNELARKLSVITQDKNNSILSNNFELASELKIMENKIMDSINNLELELCNSKKKLVVTREDVAHIIYSKTNIPVYEILNDSALIVSKVTQELSSHIRGQDNAINSVVNVLKKIKLGFKDDNRCYSMLFCGPSGVGKTELAKLFGKTLVGDNVIKLDMSEFSESSSVSRFLGSSPGYVGYHDNNNIFEQIRNKPHSVLILDEIERAHSSVINLFFSIFDDGKIKDSVGNTIRFDNVTVIMTSNIGFVDSNIGFSNDVNNEVFSKLKEYFSVSFINRIDDVISFNRLNMDDILLLIKEKIDKLMIKYKDRDVSFRVDDSIYDMIVDLSNYEEFGARKLDKIIKSTIECQIIEGIINNDNDIYIRELVG